MIFLLLSAWTSITDPFRFETARSPRQKNQGQESSSARSAERLLLLLRKKQLHSTFSSKNP